VPYPPDKGDRIRSYHLLEHLARLGEVDLAFLSDQPPDGATLEPLNRLCRRVAAMPVSRPTRWARAFSSLALGRSLTEGLFASRSLRDLIGNWLGDTSYDSIVVFSSGVLPHVLGRGLDHRLVVDLVDVDSQKWLDYAARGAGLKAALFRLEGRRVRALERAARDCRAVVLATEPEADIYRAFCPTARVLAIPNGVDLGYFRPALADDEAGGCVFVGQLDYRANILGLEWFCREVWPLVRSSLPDATFRVVGRNPVAAVRRLAGVPGVDVVGPVADVRPELAAARVVAVPLPVARGVQNKVLEAMAMGKAVVASTAALDGLDLQVGRAALAATDPVDWRRAIVGLWEDRERRAELGRAARRHVEACHRWETCLGRFDGLILAAPGTLQVSLPVRANG
jgi:sugar transferase (PEP-CTERM/EpsH1 system associated)